MIQFKQVNKRYQDNDFHIQDLNFIVDPGEFLFLIGPSGSGKTTVIKMLIREELPSDGSIYFDDFDITRLSRDSVYKLRRQIGVVFQDYKLIPDKTVAENVAFAMEVAGKNDKQIKETVPYLLDIVGLSHRAKAFPVHLSGGEKQRVSIARAVANNPRVLIADEPTGNLDPASAWDIVQILSKINNWGTTVIMSTHGTDIVNTLNKRVIQMEDGRVIRDDRKGFYEKTSLTPEQKQQIQDEIQQEKRGPIKVNFRKKPQSDPVSADIKPSRGIFSRIKDSLPFIGSNPDQMQDQDLSTTGDSKVDGSFTPTSSEDKHPAKVNAQQLRQIMADADNVKLNKLNLSTELVERLGTAGYTDIEDIITAGPDTLFAEQLVDNDEVVEIAQSIEVFIKSEEQKLQSKSEENEEEDRKAVVDSDGADKEENQQVQTDSKRNAHQSMDAEKKEAEASENKGGKAVKIKLDLAGKKD